MRKILPSSLILMTLIALFFSCNKPIITYEGILEFSSDTLMFDTVFTTQGSSLRTLKVYNNTDEHLIISHVVVCGGEHSQFSINVNGLSGYVFDDIEIEPNDSIYIFANVRIDPTNINSPLVVEDSICFRTNNSEQFINLIAWGQDANYIIADTYVEGLPPYKIVAAEGEVTIWNSPKPYVIYGYAVADSTGQLIIEAGTKVHLHSNGGIWIYKGGSIKVMGTAENKVVFEGDRLEPSFDSIPGQWEKIWINEGSVNNEFHHAIIKNGLVGIHAQTLEEPMGNILILDNVEIHSMSSMGIYAMSYAIFAGNTVISNCKNQLMYLSMGGYYDFRNCTFANYYKGSREVSSVFVSNFYQDLMQGILMFGELDAYFGNCIIFGNKKNEFNTAIAEGIKFECKLENSIVKIDDDKYDFSKYMTNCIKNQHPIFKDSLKLDYRLDTITSPAINAGLKSIVMDSPAVDITTDFYGKSRIDDDAPDIGAFEFIDIP